MVSVLVVGAACAAEHHDATPGWAWQPIQRTVPPRPADGDWSLGDIDRFILARLENEGLKPAPEADRYHLLRRVTFDLTGLPPTPEEIESFIQDSSDLAYEKCVDRLLASPGFGDHWARHWFDLSCYADLADISGNMLIREAWRYRDYVIDAFNSDKPFDRFMHEQIAGDLLPYDTVEQRREQIIATGYLAIGPWTLQNYIKGQMDADIVDHQIDRIGRTFLGMTLSCARCHDHKFDPIPTADYYALAGIFHSTRTTSYDGPGVWSRIVSQPLPVSEADQARRKAERDLAQRQLEELTRRREEIAPELGPLLRQLTDTAQANVLTLKDGIEANLADTRYHVTFESGPSVWQGLSQKTTARDGLLIEILRLDGEILASHTHYPGAWPGGSDAQKMAPGQFSYSGDGSGAIRIRITASPPGSGRFGGAIDNLRITHDDQSIFQETFNSYQPGATSGAQSDTGRRVFAAGKVPGWQGAGINHSHAVELGQGDIAIQFFAGQATALTSIKTAHEAEQQLIQRAAQLEEEMSVLASRCEALQQDHVETALAVRDVEAPADSPIHVRGDWQSPGGVVPRGFLSAVPVGMTRDIPPDASGRRELAQWLTDRENPLTARVLINRVWQHVFGSGLVRSVDYFGVHGEKPSHPELLDYLARQFMEDGWSLKRAVRRMVMSRTYRMAVDHDAVALAHDPDNRLRWRMSRRRLTAESIRDAMLAASGQLDPGRGGPSLGLDLPGNINGLGGNINPPTWAGKIPGQVKNRRAIYLPLKRERPGDDLEILSVFDFPHPSEMTGARPETTVATQALFLMNSSFVKEQAAKLAERVLREASDDRSRVARLHLLTLNQPPDNHQMESALSFVAECQRDLASLAEPSPHPRSEAWTQLCHAVLASNGFLFRE